MEPFSHMLRQILLPVLVLLAGALGACRIDQPVSYRTQSVGPLQDNQSFQPVAIDAARIALRSAGEDGIYQSADDELIIVTLPSGKLTRIGVPYLTSGDASRPVVVGTDTVVMGIASTLPQVAIVRVDTAVDNQRYTVTINDSRFSVTAPAMSTTDMIAAALVTAISGGTEPVTATAPAITPNIIVLQANTPGTAFSLSVSTNLATPRSWLLSPEPRYPAGTVYSINIGGQVFSYTHSGAETASNIAFQLFFSVFSAGSSVEVTPVDLVTYVLLVANDAASPPIVSVGSKALSMTVSDGSATLNDFDDGLAVVSNLSATTPSVAVVAAGPITAKGASRPVNIDGSSIAMALGSYPDPGCTATPDPSFGTDDDALATVTGIPGSPTVQTPVCLGFLSDDEISRPVAITPAAGPAIGLVVSRGVQATDQFGQVVNRTYVIPNLDTTPGAPVSVQAGPLHSSQASRAVFLTDTPDVRALVSTGGSNGIFGDADDTVSLLYNLDTAPEYCLIAAPGHGTGTFGQALVVSDSIALLPGAGPDNAFSTPDDRVNLLSALDTATPWTTDPQRVCDNGPMRDLMLVPNIFGSNTSQPLLISPTEALIATEGPDGVPATGDDAFQLLEMLDTPPGSVGASFDFNAPFSATASHPGFFPMSVTPALFFRGVDDPAGGATLYSVTDPAGTAKVRSAVIPPLEGSSQAPVPMLSSTAIGIQRGADGIWGTPDDGVVIIPF